MTTKTINLRFRRIQRKAEAVLFTAILVGSSMSSTAAWAANSPGFGSDSGGPGATGSSGAYHEPTCSPVHNYEIYVGEVGTAIGGGASKYEAPGSAYNKTAMIQEAHNMYLNGHGAGAGAYFFLGGPGWASGTGGATTNAEAYSWGEQQAADATNDYNSADAAVSGDYSFLFIMGDLPPICWTPHIGGSHGSCEYRIREAN